MSGSLFDFVRDLLLLEWPDTLDEEERREHAGFVMKFQQLTGPVMAKGVEDTAFYVYNRLVSLNEVGGEPDRFGVSRGRVPRLQRRSAPARWPGALLAAPRTTPSAARTSARASTLLSEIPDAGRRRSTAGRRRTARTAATKTATPSPTPTTSTCSTRRWSAPGRWEMDDAALRGVRRAHPAVHGEGHARGQGPHQLDQPQRGVRRRRCATSSRADPAATRAFLADLAAFQRRGRAAGDGQLAGADAAEDRLPRRARRLPGDGALGPQPGRPRQPPPGRLRAAPARC